MHKHKLQQVAAAQGQQAAGALQAAQVQPAQAAQANPQLAAVAAPRPGAVLTGTTVANLHVARLVRLLERINSLYLSYLLTYLLYSSKFCYSKSFYLRYFKKP